MPLVVALIVGIESQSFVREQVGTLGALHFVETMDELERAALELSPDVVLADLRDRAGAGVLPSLAMLRGRRPALPLVVCPAPAPAALQDLHDVVSSGLDIGVLLRGFEHIGLGLRAALASRHAPSAGETLVEQVVPRVSSSLRSFFTLASVKASPRLRVLTAATWCGLAPRSLERHLQAERLPNARTVIGSCVGLHVAWWLDVQGWSVKQVIAEMGFGDPAALARPLKRHFGCTPRTLRAAGGFNALLRHFNLRLTLAERGPA